MFIVPVAAPRLIAVAAPKALTVVLLVLNKVTVPVVDAWITGALPLILKTVAFVKVTVVFLIDAVPVAAPIVRAVAAPKALTVVLLVLNKVTVPVVDAWITGSFPLMFNTVAFPKVAVVLLMFTVPVLDPREKVVAAVNALTVVDVPVNILNVVAVDVKSPPFKATSPCMVRLPFVALRRNDVPVPAVFTIWLVEPSPTKFTNSGKRSVSEVSRLAVSWFADVTSVV